MNANELADEWNKSHQWDEFQIFEWEDKAEKILRTIPALEATIEATALFNYNKGYEDGRKLAVIEVLKSHPAELTDEEI